MESPSAYKMFLEWGHVCSELFLVVISFCAGLGRLSPGGLGWGTIS